MFNLPSNSSPYPTRSLIQSYPCLSTGILAGLATVVTSVLLLRGINTRQQRLMAPFILTSFSAAIGLFLLAAWLWGTALYYVSCMFAFAIIAAFFPFCLVYKICMEAVVGHYVELEVEGLEDDSESILARQSFVYSDELEKREMP